MQKVGKYRHSRLYYRNSFLVWTLTILVFWTALTAPRHWATMVLVMVGLYLNYFLWVTYLSVHPGRSIFRRRIPTLEVDLKVEKVTFLSRDGLQLCGWLVLSEQVDSLVSSDQRSSISLQQDPEISQPARSVQFEFPESTNRAEKRPVIILLHGLGGTGREMSYHARILQKAGYNVLMLDLRSHGESEGDTITAALEVNDVLGALDFLATCPTIDVSRVGILGVSFGAQVALQAVREIRSIQAVVLESMGPVTLADHGGRPKMIRRWLNYPFNGLLYLLFDFMSGESEREGV